MSSPKTEVFFVFNENTGALIPGILASMSFDLYMKDTGVNVTPQPTFYEIGSGAYGFTPTFADTDHGIAYSINTSGSPVMPKHITRFMRPEDWNEDMLVNLSGSIDLVKKVQAGRWKINTGTNQMVFYDTDGVTALLTFTLKDASGNPASTSVFERV